MLRRFGEPPLGRLLVPHLAVAKHDDPHQGPLALRVAGMRLVQATISFHCSLIIQLFLFENCDLGQLVRCQLQAQLRPAGLVVNREGLAFYGKALDERGLTYVPSHANFLLVKTGDGDRVFKNMLKQGVIVRAMSGYKLPDWVRISMGTPAENQRCLEVLDSVLATAAES